MNEDPTLLPDPAAARFTREGLPAIIGTYRILRLLGEGGMGAVYLAEQQHPKRTVALKVIKAGLAGTEFLLRFHREVDVLGRLQHPGIAQIYEAGTTTTASGPRPFFAMEFIQGELLRRAVAGRQLDTRERLALMARVCDAVQHAHQRGIIHRDLKPANIMVDDSGQPKILDFGIAGLTDGDVYATRQTDVGQLIGTVAYMSPEQVLADPTEVDTRSDVYALGVILYELLADRLPGDLDRKPLHEAVQIIRNEDPPALSSVNRTYRGDVETIVAKALEKDRARRYASAAELAADLRRYLHDEPIVARPPSAVYQVQKFARRHTAVVAGAAAVVVVLIGGTVVSTWQALRATRAEQAARTEAQTATAVAEFLTNDLLAQASNAQQARPGVNPNPNLTVRTALDRAASRIDGKFAGRPQIEASIRQTIGAAYADLGVFAEAEAQFRRALQLIQESRTSRDADTLRLLTDLGDAQQRVGKLSEAAQTLTTTLAMQRRLLGTSHPDVVSTASTLGAVYRQLGRYGEAEQLLGDALTAVKQQHGEGDPETAVVKTRLALLYYDARKYSQARSLFEQALPVLMQFRGAEHPDTVSTINNLALVCDAEGRYDEAVRLYQQVLTIQSRVRGLDHPNTLATKHNLAGVLFRQRRYAESERLLHDVLASRRRVLGAEHPATLNTAALLADVYNAQRRFADSEALLVPALAAQRRDLGIEHARTIATISLLARAYVSERKFPRAESLLIDAYEAAVRQRTSAGVVRGGAAVILTREIVQLYESWGKPTKAETWRRNEQAAARHE